jgi:hypothetical protein
MLYDLILNGGEVNINALMDQLEQENKTLQQCVVRRHDNTIVDVGWNIEVNTILEGDELFGFEQTLLLETYLENLIRRREWMNVLGAESKTKFNVELKSKVKSWFKSEIFGIRNWKLIKIWNC